MRLRFCEIRIAGRVIRSSSRAATIASPAAGHWPTIRHDRRFTVAGQHAVGLECLAVKRYRRLALGEAVLDVTSSSPV